MSKKDLVELSKEVLDKSIKHYKANADGEFVEENQFITHNFQECIENADKGYLVSFFVEDVTLLSQKIALSENIVLDFDAPYVLLKMGIKIPVYDAKDLEKKLKQGVWETFFEKFSDPTGLEGFNPRD